MGNTDVSDNARSDIPAAQETVPRGATPQVADMGGLDVQHGTVAQTDTAEVHNGSSACTPAPDTSSSHANPDGPRQPSQYCALR
eukprot:11181741-Lingulodinium_polyedra.AAC.1